MARILRIGLAVALLVLLALALVTGMFVRQEAPLVSALPRRIRAELAARNQPWVPLGRIPKGLQTALIATEDRSFYYNLGVSFEGILRSVVADLLSGRFVEGGSTITQELARDQLLTLQKTISRKLKEMVIALMITHDFSKPEILEMYLNQVYLGHGAYGVGAAARTYFGRPVQDLSLAQCAILAGLPRAPSYLDPLTHYRAAKERQGQVLSSMVAAGYLSAVRARQVYGQPLDLVPGRRSQTPPSGRKKLG